ncbi:MAG: hypothetical protein ACK4TK_07355 [Thiobacillaceae bacterium]
MRQWLLALTIGLTTLSAAAGKAPAEAALTRILKAEGITNVSYKVQDDGFIHIVFSGRMMDAEYDRVLELLNRHPDIPGVLAAREADVFCRP